MLSSTSGSMSSRLGSERICTLRGAGCSGSGSFLPPLCATSSMVTRQLSQGCRGPRACYCLCTQPAHLGTACALQTIGLRAGFLPPSLAGPRPQSQAKQVISGRKSYLHIPCVFLNVL